MICLFGLNIQYIWPFSPIFIIWTIRVNDYGSKILRMTGNIDDLGYLVVFGACLLYFLEIIGTLLVMLFIVIAYKILIQNYIVNLSTLLWEICFFHWVCLSFGGRNLFLWYTFWATTRPVSIELIVFCSLLVYFLRNLATLYSPYFSLSKLSQIRTKNKTNRSYL